MSIPNFFTFVSAMVWYLVLTILVMVFSNIRPALREEYCTALVLIVVCMMVYLLYGGICYKLFWIGLILFALSITYVYLIGRERIMSFLVQNIGVDLTTNFVVGLIIILAGCILSILLRIIFYKKELSSIAMGAVLRKAMK